MKTGLFLFLLTVISCQPPPKQTTGETPRGYSSPEEALSRPAADELPPWKKAQTDWIWCECLENEVPVWNKQLKQKVHIIMVLKETVDGEIKMEKSYSQRDVNNKCQRFTEELVGFGNVDVTSLDQVRSEDIQQCEKGEFDRSLD